MNSNISKQLSDHKFALPADHPIQNIHSRDNIIKLLSGCGDQTLFEYALHTKEQTIGSGVYLRGLIEFSNRCIKDCLYCGIRCSNQTTQRYELDVDQVIEAARYAFNQNYGSVVIQAGEQTNSRFINKITECIRQIKKLSNNKLGITISLGEQTPQTYKDWFEAGAHRYLLRIESSDRCLYEKIHPTVGHNFEQRLECLNSIQNAGFQLGTGVMIGLPGQTIENLANDLLFLNSLNIDMCGMGPYIEHPDAPLGNSEWHRDERLMLTRRMIAILRIMMPKINIASTTALHALHPQGRELGVASGANILMPNITPDHLRPSYKLYDNKPMNDIDLTNFDVRYGEWGDSKHFAERTSK